MDIALALNRLWQHKRWFPVVILFAVFVGLSTQYHVGFLPPSFEKKTIEFGSANTDILVDTPSSALIDLQTTIEPLAMRAAVYSTFMQSDPVRLAIAKESGIPPEYISIVGASAGDTTARTNSNQRSDELAAQEGSYTIFFRNEQGSPIIQVYAQAPTADAAGRLANGAADGVSKMFERLQNQQHTPRAVRVSLRKLGDAQGVLINQGANRALLFLGIIGGLLAGLAAILIVSSVRDEMRRGGSFGKGPEQRPGPTGVDLLDELDFELQRDAPELQRDADALRRR